MATKPLGFPVFHADNHLYETRDALTKYLPAERRRHRFRRAARTYQDHGERASQQLHTESDV
jgi:hypothetical protein